MKRNVRAAGYLMAHQCKLIARRIWRTALPALAKVFIYFWDVSLYLKTANNRVITELYGHGEVRPIKLLVVRIFSP
jgi:hypothetical protein